MRIPDIENFIQRRINRRVDNLYHIDSSGRRRPPICIVCDRLIQALQSTSPSRSISPSATANRHNIDDVYDLYKNNTITAKQLDANRENLSSALHLDKPACLLQCYEHRHDPNRDMDSSYLCGLMLSPRASYVSRTRSDYSVSGYTCCESCKYDVLRKKMPLLAISNNYVFGEPPSCLTDLSQIELAFLTPVKTHGYCFCWTGGKKKVLKGTLSYLKSPHSSIIKLAATFETTGLRNNIVVVLYGSMTKQQRQETRKQCTIRTKKILDAVKWLLTNNIQWRNSGRTYDSYVEELKERPIIVDNANEVDSEDPETECAMSFSAFFPAGDVRGLTGGQRSPEEFKQMLKDARRYNYDIAFQCNLQREYVREFKDENLVNACLLQFPYGYGGMHETRYDRRGNLTNTIFVEDYVKNLSLISQNHFHEDLFVLILYNIFLKQQVLKKAGMTLRNGATASLLATSLTHADVDRAVFGKVHGVPVQTIPGHLLIQSIDSVARGVPHSNDATRNARHDVYATQNHFGMPSYFLTVTPDDDNSLLMQVLTGVIIDDDTDIAELTDEMLRAKAKSRTTLRLTYPGLCSFNFDNILDILIDEVIGWNQATGCAHASRQGLFGTPVAYTIAVEEQGRRSLHAHMLLWIKQFDRWREGLYSENRTMQRVCEQLIIEHVDEQITTKLFDEKACSAFRGQKDEMFAHKCTENSHIRRLPEAMDDQHIRNLRHKQGYTECGSLVARCQHCPQTWSQQKFLQEYLIKAAGVSNLSSLPDNKTRRLKTIAIQHQMGVKSKDVKPHLAINASYNQHFHCGPCFEKSKTTLEKVKPSQNTTTKSVRKRKAGKQIFDECRYRLPKKPRRSTHFVKTARHAVDWFDWMGNAHKRFINEIALKQHPYDIFQNAFCPAISFSKLTCNTNASAILPGPMAQYTVKYAKKNNQREETEPYANVRETLHRHLSRAIEKMDCEVSDRSKAMAMILCASFANNATNVVGAPLASYYTRNGSRFRFSHKFHWIPIRDLSALLTKGKVGAAVGYTNGTPHFRCEALNYLCRPLELEHLDPHDFFTCFQTTPASKRTMDATMDYVNTEFTHPSYQVKSNTFLHAVKEREQQHLARVFQYDFPDTGTFGGDLSNSSTFVTNKMEKWSRNVLLLFSSYRRLSDILTNGSYTQRLRTHLLQNTLNPSAQTFLQNLQDAHYNCFRLSQKEDDLQRRTQPYSPANASQGDDNDSGSEDERDPEIDRFIEAFTSIDVASAPIQENEPIDFQTLRQKGAHRSGYHLIAEKYQTKPASTQVQTEESTTTEDSSKGSFLQRACEESNTRQNPAAAPPTNQPQPLKKDLIRIYVDRRSSRLCKLRHLSKKKSLNLREANGSARSILNWAKRTKLDRAQKKAFEILAATFVLSMQEDATPLCPADYESHAIRTEHNKFTKEMARLRYLVRRGRRIPRSGLEDQLVCFIHGPGGCGKTTVIDLVIEYAREYCGYMSNYTFTKQTIVVTAMTGVAATVLLGQTTHKALRLCREKELTEEDIVSFMDTKMVIIDEISFAAKKDIINVSETLCEIRNCWDRRYGGIHMVFSGDFRQLEPVDKHSKPLYEVSCPEFDAAINCYIELEGMHRFRKDMEWGRLLRRFRNGEMTLRDIQKINSRVIRDAASLPDGIRYASYRNRERDAINTALFEERTHAIFDETGETEDTVMILASEVEIRNGSKLFVPFTGTKTFWEHCGEDDCKAARQQGRLDPVLKLYRNSLVMIPTNIDVASGMANGTTATVQNVIAKPDAAIKKVLLGGKTPVTIIKAEDVDHIVLRHTNDRIEPRTFNVHPRKIDFKCNLPVPELLAMTTQEREQVRMKALQLPVVSTAATTGHKLQGSGVDAVLVHDWCMVTNWTYVMLSRVRTLEGLFLRRPLPLDTRKFAMPPSVARYINFLRTRSPPDLSKEEYALLLERDFERHLNT